MSLVRKWSGDDVGGLDSTFQSLATTIVYDTSGNLQFQGTGTRLAAYSPLGSIATFSVWIRKLNLSAIPTTSAAILSPLDSGGAQAWRLMVNTAGAIQIRDAANVAGTAYGTAMTTATDYNVKVEGTTSSITITLYNGSTSAQIGTPVTYNSTFGSVDNFRFGNATGTIAQYTMGAIWFYDTTTAPSLPADGITQTTPKVAIIGDSLTNMAPNATSIFGLGQALLAGSFAARGYGTQNIYLWGVGGKRITVADLTGRTSMSNWADAVAMLSTVDYVIVALGTNDRPQIDSVVNTAIDTLFTAIGSTPYLVWIGLTSKQFASTDDIRLNGDIAAKIATRGNGAFADWDTFIRAIDGGANPSSYWQTTDTTHMTATGYQIRSDFYAAQLPNLAAVTVTAPVATSTAQGYAPAVAAGVTLIAPVATATSSAVAPAINAGVNLTAVRAGATSLAYPPTLAAGARPTAPVATSTAIAYPPNVQAGSSVTVSAPVATGTASAAAPVVNAGVTLTPARASGSGLAYQPTIGAGVTVVSPRAGGTAVAYAPTLILPVTLSIPVAAATARAYAPGVSTGVVTEAVITGHLTPNGPTGHLSPKRVNGYLIGP